MKKSSANVCTISLLFAAFSAFAQDSAVDKPKFSDPKKNFEKIVEILQTKYQGENVRLEDLYEFAAQGMIDGLNHRKSPVSSETKLLPPNVVRPWNDSPAEEVVGIGIEIEPDKKTGYMRILRVVPDGAADKTGLERGDLVLQVNDKTCKQQPLEEFVDQVRGKPGHSVKLKLLRGNRTLSKNIVREKMQIPRYSYSSTILNSSIGYVRIDQFQDDTLAILQKIAEGFTEKGIHKLIVDLRSCSGGHLDKIAEAGGIFLPAESSVARFKEYNEEEHTLKTSAKAPTFLPKQTAILINQNTTAGCELFAAALRNNLSAVLVGEPTEGRADLQGEEVLPNHFSVVFTKAVLKLGNGNPYQGIGLKPDIAVKNAGYRVDPSNHKIQMDRQIREDRSLQPAFLYLEKAEN